MFKPLEPIEWKCPKCEQTTDPLAPLDCQSLGDNNWKWGEEEGRYVHYHGDEYVVAIPLDVYGNLIERE